MDLLNFVTWRKTHGNQFLITGIKYNTQQHPKLKITFFPSTSYVQIQCETDELETALLNFTMLMNYFKLEDPMKEFYDERTGKVKNDSVKNYLQEKTQDKNIYDISGDFTGIGTEKFNVRQQFQKIQDSQLDELQQIDPVSFGMDDRYEYQKLVTDVQKRPVQIAWKINEVDVFKKKNTRGGNIHGSGIYEGDIYEGDIYEGGVCEGGAKGSPVYVNNDYDYSEFLLYQHDLVVNGFLLNNQTFAGIYNRYKCSSAFPYLLLGNTKGKDSITCAMDPINPAGLSIFEFYDVGTRLMVNSKIIKYIKPFLYGRVSVSAVKFQQWIIPGRCSEIPLNLKKLLGSNTLFLSVMHSSNYLASDIQYEINPVMDMEWIESVFGQPYNEMFDGDIIYDYQNEQYYSTNPKGKNQSFWVKFPNHKKYLVIMDEIVTKAGNGRKNHYYKPYFNKFQLQKQSRKFDLQYYKKFDIQGYIEFPQHNYLVTKQGVFPVIDSCDGLKKYDIPIQNKLPTYDIVKKMVDDTDNYIINYKAKKIGTKYNDLYFYWKETDFETDQKLTIGTYMININDRIHLQQKGPKYNFQVVAYCIFTYIQLQKYQITKNILQSTDSVKMVAEALDDVEKVIQIIKYLNRLQQNDDEMFYLNKYIPLLSSIKEKDVKPALQQLKKLVPDTDQLKFDYIRGLSLFSNNKNLTYNPGQKEEILKLKIKKDFDFE